jgi:23S rRNA pseudouridine1911/1915/1917 synthase
MMPKQQTFHLASDFKDAALPTALRALLPHLSWSQIKGLIRQRRVQVNGNLCLDEGRTVKAGDVIRISDQSLAAPVTAKEVRIVHVDQHVVVIDKPPGVTTLRHSEEKEWSDQRKQRQATLDELVEELVRTPVRAVHRLDRDTSGLMVFARTPAAEAHLIRQFKKHTVDRAYIAIARGDVGEETIESMLVRDRGDGLRGSTSDPKAGDAERAVTHVRPLEKLSGYTVVECRLETGRTHQIRIHLSERGHMLCGEKTYVRPLGGSAVEDASGAMRQALHAAVLGFEHPASGQRLQFVSPLPRDMAKLLERLRKVPGSE